MAQKKYIWESTVRGYELDNQQIVNNAIYLHYFNNARLLCLKSLGINWAHWHRAGFNLVLVKSELEFKAPLKEYDQFKIITSYAKQGKVRVAFSQELYNTKTNKLSATANNIVVCVDLKSGKPVWHSEIASALFLS